MLGFAGMIPVVGIAFDLINTGIYLARGDYVNAALSAASAIPIAGLVVGGAAIIARCIRKAARHGDTVVSAVSLAVRHFHIFLFCQKTLDKLKIIW